MTASVMTSTGSWVTDRRGRDRGLRITGHPECDTIVLSAWREGVCTSTVRLSPEAAAEVVRALTAELAALALRPEPYDSVSTTRCPARAPGTAATSTLRSNVTNRPPCATARASR